MAHALAASFRLDEEILEKNSGLRKERGIVVEEQSEALRHVVDVRDQHLCRRMFAEQSRPKCIYGCDAFVTHFLVFSE